MNGGDSELDGESATIRDDQTNARVSGNMDVSSNAESSVNSGAGSAMELDSVARESGADETDARVSENKRSEGVGAIACNLSGDIRIKEGDSGVSEPKIDSRSIAQIDSGDWGPEGKNSDLNDRNQVHASSDDFEARDQEEVLKVSGHEEPDKYRVADYKSLLSEFDDYVASEKMDTGISRALSYGLEVGDLVWGKVKSHPWWPGHIFNEAFASSSVRRTRRVGYVLVAFFGDSSYGWFDPAELIPFEPHFAEKSEQTNSRNFMRAVEEAVDEASRRSALGLACKCRNPYNFRPSNVQGYFAVDVPDYEPQAVYSADQIRKGRESFLPSETLSFLKYLALAPQDSGSNCIDFLKKKASIFAFRRAVFEEFDETYAQAFGVKNTLSTVYTQDQPPKEPPRAPLSGPLVIAETLGDGKSSKKSMKVKDNSKQDKYLFKRRDETGDSRTIKFSQMQASSSIMPSGYVNESSGGDYVLQRRALAVPIPVKDERPGSMSKDAANSSTPGVSGRDVLTDQIPLGSPSIPVDLKPSFDKEKVCSQEAASPTMVGNAEGGKSPTPKELLQQSGLPGSASASHSLPSEADVSGGANIPGKVKKVKGMKRAFGDLGGSEDSSMKIQKKRKKKEPGSEASLGDPEKKNSSVLAKGGAAAGNKIKKSVQSASAFRDDVHVHLRKKNVGSSSSLFNFMATLEVPEVLNDLQSLALNPFHGVEKNIPGVVRRFFLRFRSLVYQKSLVLPAQSVSETSEGRVVKPKSNSGIPGSPASETGQDTKQLKPAKALGRADDPTKAGKKRLISDCQGEIAAKKLKRANQLKSLASEKKTGPRTIESSKTEGKEQAGVASAPMKHKSLPVKKSEPPPSKAGAPTMLVMKFPPDTNLPSAAQLKARFGRFGSLDQSAIRVFWKSSTCRVVFMHKSDAQSAYRYALGNHSLFGNVSVRYHLREVEAPASEAVEPNKGRVDDSVNESLRVKEPPSEWAGPTPIHQPILQPPVSLKSCLKRPTSDDPGQAINGARGATRVKFMLAGEETPTRTEQMANGNRNSLDNKNSVNFTEPGGPSSVGTEFVSKNFQNVNPSTQFAKASPANNLHLEISAPPPPRNSHNVSSPFAASPSSASADISHQMLSLLTRCNDVVSNVTGLLGYVPYHPL